MRIRIDECAGSREDEDVLLDIGVATAAATRAAALADRVASLAGPDGSVEASGRIGEIARASGILERLLSGSQSPSVRLGIFLDRFVTLRAIVAGGGRFQISAGDAEVEATFARAIALILCDLVSVAEGLSSPAPLEVLMVVEFEGDELLIAVAVPDGADAPVSDLAGMRALARAERLVHLLGGNFARGVRDGMMLFGATLQVRDD